MVHGPTGSVLHGIRKMVAIQAWLALSDQDLLERFCRERDQAAFAALLERHGGMVLAVCRRVLGHVQDAEDACQATFLVFARKATSIHNQASTRRGDDPCLGKCGLSCYTSCGNTSYWRRMMAPAIAYPHIVKENGQPARLENHPRVRVAQIVMDYLAHGWSPEEICNQYQHLSHAEVYAAMTYYHDHRDEIETEIQAELKQLETDRKLAKPSPFYLRMKAAGKL